MYITKIMYLLKVEALSKKFCKFDKHIVTTMKPTSAGN